MTFVSSDQTASQTSTGFLANKDIVVVSLAGWDGPKRIRQYLTEELVRRGNRILFVDAHYTLSKFIRWPDLPGLFRFLRGPRLIHDLLYVLSSFPFLPGGEFSILISRINWAFERILIKRSLRRLGFRDTILWIFAYNAGSLPGTLNESLSLYFCNDSFADLVRPGFLRPAIMSLERKLLRKVDIVFTVSEKLTEEKGRWHKDVRTIHHGVDFPLFEKALVTKSIPSDLPPHGPIIGYSGVVRYMIDLDLLEFLALHRPKWSLVFVGPVTESSKHFYARIERLKRLPNVRFLGPRAIEQLPLYIRSFDVCLLPYVRTRLSTYYAAPLKFYEYLAAGRPVVSTVGPYTYGSEVVRNGSTPEEIIAAIEVTLHTDSARRAQQRRAVAKENSWKQRVDQIEKTLGHRARR